MARILTFFIRARGDAEHFFPLIWACEQGAIPETKVNVVFTTDDGASFLAEYGSLLGKAPERVRFLLLTEYRTSAAKALLRLLRNRRISIRECIILFIYEYAGKIPLLNLSVDSPAARAVASLPELYKEIAGSTDDKHTLIFDPAPCRFYREMCHYFKSAKRRFCTVAIHHGDLCYVNKRQTPWLPGHRFYSPNGSNITDNFDFISLPNQYIFDIMFPEGLPPEKAKRIWIEGSPRYQRSWVERVQHLSPKVEEPSKGIKILFLLRNDGLPIFEEGQFLTVALILLTFSCVSIYVKFHPRSYRKKMKVWKKYQKKFPGRIRTLPIKSLTLPAIADSDLIVNMGTSAAFDAIQLGKPVLSLDFLHFNYSTTAYFMPSTEARTRDDALRIIGETIENKSANYSAEEHACFVSALINRDDAESPAQIILQRLQNCDAKNAED